MYYIVFNSITAATAVKKSFDYKSDYIGLSHTPSEISSKGCSYCLIVHKYMVDEIVKTASEMNIKIKNIYVRTENGFIKYGDKQI